MLCLESFYRIHYRAVDLWKSSWQYLTDSMIPATRVAALHRELVKMARCEI